MRYRNRTGARSPIDASWDSGRVFLSNADAIWAKHQDAKGVSAAETRTDYSRFNEPVHVPSSFNGKMPNSDPIKSGATFMSIRSWYKKDPDYPKVQACLRGRGRSRSGRRAG